LKASISHGTVIEDEIKKSLPRAGMTATITARSEYETSGLVRRLSRRLVVHSDDKLVWFYLVRRRRVLEHLDEYQSARLRCPGSSSRLTVA
jgi:hypothetical protein